MSGDIITQQAVDFVIQSLELQEPYTLFWVQEMLESTAELDHSLRMKGPLLHLILMTSQSALIRMLLLLQIRISSWTAFMGHTSLKVPLLLATSSIETIMSFSDNEGMKSIPYVQWSLANMIWTIFFFKTYRDVLRIIVDSLYCRRAFPGPPASCTVCARWL
jgi:hypothetical protein